MIELPEAVVIARQITQTLGGKRIARAVANASPHKFAWYSGDPACYNQLLAGKMIGNRGRCGRAHRVRRRGYDALDQRSHSLPCPGR